MNTIGKRDGKNLSELKRFFQKISAYTIGRENQNNFLKTNKYLITGKVLDIGAGYEDIKEFLEMSNDVFRLDMDRKGRPDVFGDAGNLPVKEKSFDTILCLQVLEHTPNPEKIVKEANKVLKYNGIFIVSVPMAWAIHMQEDYYRFTEDGLKYILESNGFEIIKLEDQGGFFTVLTVQTSLLLKALSSKTKFSLLIILTIMFCYLFQKIGKKVDYFDKYRKFVNGYNCIAKKVIK